MSETETNCKKVWLRAANLYTVFYLGGFPDNPSKKFHGVAALSNVNLTVYPGEVHALMGENGAGKSTLMKILAGAYETDAGEIRLNGQIVKITDPKAARQAGIALIYQELNVAPNLTVAENIFMGSEFTKGLHSLLAYRHDPVK